jgi:putative adhesin
MTASAEHRALDLTGITAVEVATFGGDLSVVTGAEHPRLQATVHGNATWSVERVGTLLYIVGKKRGFFYVGNGVGFRLWLPEQLALKLANVNADVRVRGDARSMEVSTTNGDIEVRASNPAKAKLRVVHGHVLVHGVTGRLDIVTVPGEVRVVNCGGELHITTSPGNVRLEQVVLTPGGTNTVITGNGDVEITGIHAPGGLSVRGTATHAPIDADLPDADVRNKGYRLHAQRSGPKLSTLTLNAVGKLSVKQ